MAGRLGGKVIIVAGAGGIGTGIARRFAEEGASVLLGDIDVANAEEGAAAIRADGHDVTGLHLDGADEASIAAAVEVAVERHGGLDGFHANFASFADGATGDDIVGLPLAIFDEVIRVNVRGFVLCTRHAVPAMIARGGGTMLYTSSGAAHMPEPVRCAYAMSKAAEHALMRHVATRFGPDGIRANAIAPGVVTHARFEAVIDEDMKAAMRARIPLRRLGTPEDIAAMAALLMSDDGRFVTGQVISVDGGGSMRT